MTEYHQLGREEDIIQGGWETESGVMVEDYNTRRVLFIVRNLLNEVGTDSTGWRTLYQDRSDGRYWELTYNHSDTHGGGAPLLRCISRAEIVKNYGKLI